MVLGVRRQSEECNSTARRNAECTAETKPQGIVYIINRANSGMQSRDSLRDSLEMHCKSSAVEPRLSGFLDYPDFFSGPSLVMNIY